MISFCVATAACSLFIELQDQSAEPLLIVRKICAGVAAAAGPPIYSKRLNLRRSRGVFRYPLTGSRFEQFHLLSSRQQLFPKRFQNMLRFGLRVLKVSNAQRLPALLCDRHIAVDDSGVPTGALITARSPLETADVSPAARSTSSGAAVSNQNPARSFFPGACTPK